MRYLGLSRGVSIVVESGLSVSVEVTYSSCSVLRLAMDALTQNRLMSSLTLSHCCCWVSDGGGKEMVERKVSRLTKKSGSSSSCVFIRQSP